MTEALEKLVVVVNNDKVLEYFRDRQLPEKQQRDLGIIDAKLAQGFEIAGELVTSPSPQDKAMFVANLLISALHEDEEAKISLSCAYLANYYPDLKQVKASVHEDRCTIQLINDQAYVEETKIEFTAKDQLI